MIALNKKININNFNVIVQSGLILADTVTDVSAACKSFSFTMKGVTDF